MNDTILASPVLLNLGCGQRFHSAWTNLDMNPAHPSVRHWDVSARLPFDDASFDVVYHSHLLEHLRPEQALPFLKECRRVLKPGGILRIAVPDLEAIARLYLQSLDAAWDGDEPARKQHRWLLMEMFDQTTREAGGGAMLDYLRNEACALAWYRIGADGAVIRKHLQSIPAQPRPSWRERLIRWLLGNEYPLLQIGRFRRGGEVHHWMYDRVSLRALLIDAGFTHIRCVAANESAIPAWADYHLDIAPDGAVCKPDSLFMEAEKP